MTEQEWLSSNDPQKMLQHLQGKASDRKLRLFACSCCRQVWPQLTDPRSQRAVEVAEKYADSVAFTEELIFAERDAMLAMHQAANPFEMELAWRCTLRIEALTENSGLPRWFSVSTKYAASQAALLRDLFGNPWKPVRTVTDEAHVKKCPTCNGVGWFNEMGPNTFPVACWRCEGTGTNATPHPVPVSWLTTTVLDLARAAYEERTGQTCTQCGGDAVVQLRQPPGWITVACPSCHGTGRIETGHLDPARLAILADALEEAGCTEEALLRHLRGQEQSAGVWYRCRRCGAEFRYTNKYSSCDSAGCDGEESDAVDHWIPLRGPHVRGCFVLDLILGKE